MKSLITTIVVLVLSFSAYAQTELPKVYDETIDPTLQINQAVTQAKEQNKYVICQVGGNWCGWCLRFADFVTKDADINKIINDNYIYIHVNYHPRQKNPDLMKRLGNPGRFGFPVFVILDTDGKVLHIQNSAYLEEGNGYSKKLVTEFFKAWTPTAVNTILK